MDMIRCRYRSRANFSLGNLDTGSNNLGFFEEQPHTGCMAKIWYKKNKTKYGWDIPHIIDIE